MDDPAVEIEDVVRGLVERPTFERQRKVLELYFTEDVEFKHPYINIGGGRGDLIALYQYAELFVNYQHVEFQKVVYDPNSNVVDVEMKVLTKPWLLLWKSTTLELNTILYLVDEQDPGTGKIVKKIKTQKDYFIRSPIIQLIPVIGHIYDSDKLRFFAGRVSMALFRGVRGAYSKFVPKKIQHGLFAFWDDDLSVPPSEKWRRFKHAHDHAA